MHRFYCPQLVALPPDADAAPQHPLLVPLDADQARHALRTLRLRTGDPVGLFNGHGVIATARLEQAGRITLARVAATTTHPPARPQLTLAVAPPKGPRSDDMVNQLSQLGVDRLIPLHTQRGVADARPQRLERWRRIALESAKQCLRTHLMSIENPADLPAAAIWPAEVKFIAAPGGRADATLAPRLAATASVLVLIGPEGGWTDQELAQAHALGCQAWTLGPHILRIETAAAAAAAIVRHLAMA